MSWRTYGRITAICSSQSCLCDKALAQYVNRRIGADLSRRGFVTGMGASMLSLILPGLGNAQSASPPEAPANPVLFINFRLFDGKSSTLREGHSRRSATWAARHTFSSRQSTAA